MPRKSKARGKPFVEGNQSWAGNPNDEPGAGALTSECPCRTKADIRTRTRTRTRTHTHTHTRTHARARTLQPTAKHTHHACYSKHASHKRPAAGDRSVWDSSVGLLKPKVKRRHWLQNADACTHAHGIHVMRPGYRGAGGRFTVVRGTGGS
jgi:hypothetical protein